MPETIGFTVVMSALYVIGLFTAVTLNTKGHTFPALLVCLLTILIGVTHFHKVTNQERKTHHVSKEPEIRCEKSGG